MRNVIAWKRGKLEQTMSDGKPRTTTEVAVEIGLTKQNAANAMANLFRERKVHIVGWKCASEHRGGLIAIYGYGDGLNAPRPRPTTKAQQKRRARERAESEERRLEREKLLDFKPFRDPLVAQFYGEYRREAA